MVTGIRTVLDRLSDLRLDPDAPPPAFIGLYERGVDALPVVFEPRAPGPERPER
jgi:hypothetical protein